MLFILVYFNKAPSQLKTVLDWKGEKTACRSFFKKMNKFGFGVVR